MTDDPLDYFDSLAALSPEDLLRHLTRPEPAVPAWRTGREPRTFTRPGIKAPLGHEERQAKAKRPYKRRPAFVERGSGKARVLRSLSDLKALLDEAKES